MIGFCLTLIDDESGKIIFEELYNKHRKKTFILALNILNEKYLAEDAVSETFFYIARNFNKLRGLSIEQLELYCSIAVKNISINMKKGKLKEMPIEPADIMDSKTDFAADDELRKIDDIFLEESINKLSYTDKEILTLYYFYSLKTKEISKIKKISVSAVKKRLQSARVHLKKLLEVV